MGLTPVPDLPPEKINAIRLRTGSSQPVFALYLNVSPSIVTQWEPRARSATRSAAGIDTMR